MDQRSHPLYSFMCFSFRRFVCRAEETEDAMECNFYKALRIAANGIRAILIDIDNVFINLYHNVDGLFCWRNFIAQIR